MGEDNISIAAVGDICLGDHYFSMGHGTASVLKKNETHNVFGVTSSAVEGCQIVFGNLECPLSSSSKALSDVEKTVFRGDPSFAAKLKSAGVSIVNIANNHMSQHGKEAFFETIECLKDNGISPLGLIGNDRYSSEPVIYELNNKTIGFLGYSLVPDQYHTGQELYASGPEKKICNDIKLLKQDVDVVLVSLHFGAEGKSIPEKKDVLIAKNLIESGADILLGHHSHVFHPVEHFKKGLICYSLGDYIFDLFWCKKLVESAICIIKIDAENSTSFSLKPVQFTRKYEIEELNPRSSARFLKQLNSRLPFFHKKNENSLLSIDKTQIVLQISKLLYFFINIFKGSYRLKLLFLFNKIKGVFFLFQRILNRQDGADE